MRKQNTTANKGVTATSNDIAEATKPQGKQNKDGIENIKEELANVIELMGPSTPHLISTSSTADNDESLISTSIYSSLVEVKKTSMKDLKQTSIDTPRDISEMSALPIDISETSEVENVNLQMEHNVQTCPCHQYYNAINTFSQNVIKTSQPNFQSYEKLNLQKVVEIKNNKERALSFLNLLKFRRHERELPKEPLDLYKINILQANDNNLPRRLTFELIDDIPKPNMNTIATNTSKVCVDSPLCYQPVEQSINPKSTATSPLNIPQLAPKTAPPQSARENYRQQFLTDKPTRVDVYYFDHGNSWYCGTYSDGQNYLFKLIEKDDIPTFIDYLKTTDVVPTLATDLFAEKTEAYTAKFWAEIFGTIHIFFAFLTTFILQLLRFILQSLIRPLTIGLLQLTSDYFFKPCLTVCFNALIQPPAIFLFNILTSLRDLCDPVAEGVGYFFREVANLFRSVRLVEVKNNRQIGRVPPLRRWKLRRKK